MFQLKWHRHCRHVTLWTSNCMHGLHTLPDISHVKGRFMCEWWVQSEVCGKKLLEQTVAAPVSGLVIFHPTSDTAMYECEKHTWWGPRPNPPTSTSFTESTSKPPLSSYSIPTLHGISLCPSSFPLSVPRPEGRDGSIWSWTGDVTPGNSRFHSSEKWSISLCLHCMQTQLTCVVYTAGSQECYLLLANLRNLWWWLQYQFVLSINAFH